MRVRLLIVVAVLAAVFLSACGNDSGIPDGVVDNRVPLPDSDPGYVDLVTPERIIPAYSEEQWCYYLDNPEDLVVRDMQAYQGDYGHHLVLLSTQDPKPDKTWEQCTEFADMDNLRALVLPLELPEGYGVRIPAGMQYVLQMHYVNAGPDPLLVRDLARLRTVDSADVDTWAATFTLNDGTLTVPNDEEYTDEFDCTLGQDLDLLLVGGHMHEAGARFQFSAGADADSLQSMYSVDPWRDDYRDAPPIEMYLDDPLTLPAGSVLRTSCTWYSEAFEPLDFPQEMCSAFGYLAGTKDIYYCEDGTVVNE